MYFNQGRQMPSPLSHPLLGAATPKGAFANVAAKL